MLASASSMDMDEPSLVRSQRPRSAMPKRANTIEVAVIRFWVTRFPNGPCPIVASFFFIRSSPDTPPATMYPAFEEYAFGRTGLAWSYYLDRLHPEF